MNKIKKLTHQTEFYIFLVIIVLALIIQARSNQFFTGNNLDVYKRQVDGYFCRTCKPHR